MSAYTKSLALAPTPSGKWRLRDSLQWEVGKKGSGLWVLVPPGFETDLASIPWWARGFLNPADARFAKAAILHDHLLAAKWTKPSAAAVFVDALIADEVSKWTATLMGLAVWLWTTR